MKYLLMIILGMSYSAAMGETQVRDQNEALKDSRNRDYWLYTPGQY